MRKTPTFTVVIPTHNRQDVIGNAMASVLDVHGDEVEVIVVDDGSTDGTWNRLSAVIDPRVRLLRLDPRQGAPAARNAGMDAAEADFVAFLDSDDLMLPGRLAIQHRLFTENRHAVASTGAFVGSRANHSRRGLSTLGKTRQVRRFMRLRHGSLTSSVIMVRRSGLRDIRWDETLPALQDYDFALQLAAGNRVATTRTLLAIKNVSRDRIFSGWRVASARALVLRKYNALLDPVALRRQYRALLAAVPHEYGEGPDPLYIDALEYEIGQAETFLARHDTRMLSFVDRLSTERLVARTQDILLPSVTAVAENGALPT